MVRSTTDRRGTINEWGGGICSKGRNPWTVIPSSSSIVSIVTSIVVIIASIVVISAVLIIIVVTIVVVASGTDDAGAVEGQEVGVGGALEAADDIAGSELEDAVANALG